MARDYLFTDVTNGMSIRGASFGGHGAAWADVDGDDYPDVYVTRNYYEEDISDFLFMNQSGEGFAEEGGVRGVDDTDTGSHGVFLADLDNDGDLDLWNGAYTINNLYKNDGLGNFSDITLEAGITKTDGRTRGIVAFDMDNDGDLDLFANNWGSDSGQENELYRNEGGLSFTRISNDPLAQKIGSQAATAGDIDGDGDVDIILGDYFETHNAYVFLNDGSGSFTLAQNSQIGLPTDGRVDGVTLADLNNDAMPDLIVANPTQKYIYLNNGDGTFTFNSPMIGAPGFMGAAGDFDNDGDMDLYFPGDDHIWENDGTGHFTAEDIPGLSDYSSGDPRCSSLADFDRDGDLDIITASKADYNILLRNDLSSENHWIKILLQRASGQLGAPGAKVYVYKRGGIGQLSELIGFQEVSTQQGYLAQYEQVLHFGTGAEQKVDVGITFPGGLHMEFIGLDTNRLHQIIEGDYQDLEPPEWDGNIGICDALNLKDGTSVRVEFGKATDVQDGHSVRYTLYYAPSTRWDAENWANNSFFTDIQPVAGTSCDYAFDLTGLQADVEYTVGVRVSDLKDNEDENTITATVTPALNKPPEITSEPPLEAYEDQVYLYQPVASDADQDELAWQLDAGPSGMIINNSTGEIKWTPAEGVVGSIPVTIGVDDGFGGSDTQRFTLEVSAVSEALVITSTAPTTAKEGVEYTYNAEATDANGNSLAWSLATGPEGMVIDKVSGIVTWTPDTAGDFDCVILVSDGEGGFNSQEFTITVAAAVKTTGVSKDEGGNRRIGGAGCFIGTIGF